jgi:hypothetical protein
VSGFNGNFVSLLRDMDGARRVVDGWDNEEPVTADELTNLDNVRLACNRLAESIEVFIDVHGELDPDNH